MKWIRDSHQDVWGHDHKIIRTWKKHTLVDDSTSFEMSRMTTRTDQLLNIAEATCSKIYTRESVAVAWGPAKALVLSLKQFHTHYYRLYKKVTTRTMVGLQGLHLSDAFWHPNLSASMDLKSFCPLCFKFGGNTETITILLRVVHYRLAIACNVFHSFASMSVQMVLEHWSRCMMKLHKKSKMIKWDKAS